MIAKKELNSMLLGIIELGFTQMLPGTESPTMVAGRLQGFQSNWKIVTGDQWVWDTVKDFPIPLTDHPHEVVRPTPPNNRDPSC